MKKPKLDQHYQRCGGSFTCVDCSKTFYSAGEWKGHTQCISEAEKYQKGLYKGKKPVSSTFVRGELESDSVTKQQNGSGSQKSFKEAKSNALAAPVTSPAVDTKEAGETQAAPSSSKVPSSGKGKMNQVTAFHQTRACLITLPSIASGL